MEVLKIDEWITSQTNDKKQFVFVGETNESYIMRIRDGVFFGINEYVLIKMGFPVFNIKMRIKDFAPDFIHVCLSKNADSILFTFEVNNIVKIQNG